ncbi:MAG: hypothetical protein U0Q11_01525 [Vicinamibacterales bacterium]
MTVYRLKPLAAPLVVDDEDLETTDQSLNGQAVHSCVHEVDVTGEDLFRLFLRKYDLGYVVDHFEKSRDQCRIVTHPRKTNTCYEKAELLGEWSPLNVIKALYFECPDTDALYAVVTPETGCFLDRAQIRTALRIPPGAELRKAESLPRGMTFGTCSPFIHDDDAAVNGGRVQRILFDRETLVLKRHERTLDDFSFGSDHRLSIQMNYYDCYHMLRRRFGDLVQDEEILTLAFKESFVRNRGRIKVTYEFNSLNYRISSFINSIHGYGDIAIVDDHLDELDLPDVLLQRKARATKRSVK